MSEITDKFQGITGYDIRQFFSDYIYFVNNYYSFIVGYYKDGINADSESFNELDTLKKEAAEIEGKVIFYNEVFNNAQYWDLLDKFSDIQISLNTIDNLSRWLRSSRTDRFSSEVNVAYVQKQLETLEQISKKAGSINTNDDWAGIAMKNDLNEEKYTSIGGVLMNISFSNNSTFDIKNIVDNMIGDNLYGKDLLKKFTIEEGDIKVLLGIDSLLQTFDTILNTFKGSIPEFPDDGTDQGIIGTNMNVINYPSIFRNLLNMFRKDDRFSSVDLVDLYKDQESVFLKIQAKTKIGDIMLNEMAL